MKKRKVYLDYAATTPVYPEVLQAMLPYFSEKFGNASSVHSWGQEARMAIDEAREKIAGCLGGEPEEIIFTGTTTTSDNLAIQGIVKMGDHIITSSVEHRAVLDTVKALEKRGVRATFLPVDKFGLVNLEALASAIGKETILVSIMYANNEVGTIQPIKEISKIIRQKNFGHKIYFHTDAAAAVGWLDINVNHLGVDLMSLGAHKFGGPKGIGLLYHRSGTPLEPLTFGGHHEKGFWPGTEAVPLIVGMTTAMGIAESKVKSASWRIKVRKLRDKLIEGILKIPGTMLTGHPEQRLPDIASFVVEGVEGEAMLLMLSDQGIAASSGSACTSGDLKLSHVLLAMGIPPQKAHGSIRFSLGPETTEEDINYVLEAFPKVVEKLRRLRKGIR